jgi:hypothetical protein
MKYVISRADDDDEKDVRWNEAVKAFSGWVNTDRFFPPLAQ